MKRAFTIIRVSGEDQLRGYGPDSQWYDDVLPNAPLLGLEVSENLRQVIQESATGWDREKFEAAVREALQLYHRGEVQALLFPRVDRETRFLFGSFPLLCEVIRADMKVYFARERFQLDPNDSESVSRYLRKAEEAQAYVETMRLNTMRGRRRRAERDHKMPTGGHKWAFDYDPATGRYARNEQRASWLRKSREWVMDEGCFLNECCRRLDQNSILTPDGGTKWARQVLRDILLDDANIGKFYAYKHKRVKEPNGKRRVIHTSPDQWVLVYEDPTQAIFTPEQYEGLKEKLRRNQENSPRHAIHWYPPIRGMVFCTNCCTRSGGRRRMTGVTIKGMAYYRCVCSNLVNARRLWDNLREGIKVRILEPERLVPGVKAQLKRGKSLETLEEETRSLRREREAWEQSRVKARRLHLLPNSKYTLEQYLADDRRMQEQIQRLDAEIAKSERQVAYLRQAIVDEEGIRRFCEHVAHNLDYLDDSKWRVVLEQMRLWVEVPPSRQPIAHIALPTVKETVREIASETSRCYSPPGLSGNLESLYALP